MNRKMRKALRDYQRKEEGISILVSPKEWQLIREAVETYIKHHADDMTLFEFQLLIDDMDQIEEERRKANG